MRKQTIRTLLLVAVTIISVLTSASYSAIKTTRAMPYNLFLQEYHQQAFDLKGDAANAQAFRQQILSDVGGSHCTGTNCGYLLFVLAHWNNTYLQTLSPQFLDLNATVYRLPYTPFSMDRLLLKFDNLLFTADVMASDGAESVNGLGKYIATSSDCSPVVTTYCANVINLVGYFASTSRAISQDVVEMGFLFSKAKLEMLEVPRLICNPLQVTVGSKIYCTGQSVNGTATLVLNNTQTKATTTLGTAQADSFFDVFFEITLPSSAGAGHYQMILTDSGGAQASSFFDVFVTLPTPFEPATIIPITVLIAAVATLAVASRKVRRPL